MRRIMSRKASGQAHHISTAKAAKKSANVQPASRMDTCTAERTFARNNIKYPSAKNLLFC